MSTDLILKQSCDGCGSTVELYGSTCKHLTLCVSCGKTMAEKRTKCCECGTPITRLIREYNVRACPSSDKNYFIGRFAAGLPNFSKKNQDKWSLQKEALQGRQVTDALREKFKNKPWLLEDESGTQYQGQLEGSQSATYYLLMLQGREFVAIPAGSWYNFNKVAQYKQLTLEEAEEKMRNRRKTADGYERWMMKAANNGAAAFGETERLDDRESGATSGRGNRKSGADEDEGNVSDRGEEDEEEEAARKSRLGLNKRGGDDDEEGPRGGDHDMDDDDIEKGDDWEHEEIFTDDDEAAGNAEEREDLAPEIPAPPEIKQDDDEEEEADEEGGGLSKSGKELKKLLGRANGLEESDADDDDDEEDMEDDISPVLAPKKETIKEEPVDNHNNSPAKPVASASASARSTPSNNGSKSAKGKRKVNADEAKTTNVTPVKKVKTENPVKDEPASASKSSSSLPTPAAPAKTGPVTEDEIRGVLMQGKQVTTQHLVANFKSRLRTKEEKAAFADILRKISKIQKKTGGFTYVVLKREGQN